LRKKLLEAAIVVVLEESVRNFIPRLLPYFWLFILLGLTWEIVDGKKVRELSQTLYGRLSGRQRVMSFVIVGIVSASLGLFYWWSIKKVFVALKPTHSERSESAAQNTGNTQAPERADITWNFDTEEGQFSFLGIQSVPGPVSEPLILGFQAHGKNNLDEPVLHFTGLVRSDTTNETFPIFLARDNKLLHPEDTLGIPRKAEFDLSAKPFSSNHPEGYLGAGMSASTFLRQYPELTFVFEYDGKKYIKHFTKKDIWTAVESFRRQSLGYDKP